MATNLIIKYEDFKKLADKRIMEAKFLFKKKEFSGSYYLAGYSIEVALKAYYCKQGFFPPKKTDSLYTHDLNILRDSCGLKNLLEKDSKSNADLFISWNTVKDWNSESRYQFFNKKQAKNLIEAITNKKSGILVWIKTKW